MIDDVIIFGKDKEEHDIRLMAALSKILDAGVTPNKDKCEFGKSKFRGIQADPERTAAIHEMSSPETVTELRRFLGMANQMGKFSCNLAELTRPRGDQ